MCLMLSGCQTVNRIEARERRVRYSRAQDASRRRAADELRASRVGNQPWWERMTDGFANLGAMAASYVEVCLNGPPCRLSIIAPSAAHHERGSQGLLELCSFACPLLLYGEDILHTGRMHSRN